VHRLVGVDGLQEERVVLDVGEAIDQLILAVVGEPDLCGLLYVELRGAQAPRPARSVASARAHPPDREGLRQQQGAEGSRRQPTGWRIATPQPTTPHPATNDSYTTPRDTNNSALPTCRAEALAYDDIGEENIGGEIVIEHNSEGCPE